MPTTTLERRIGALETLVQRYGGADGSEYVADIDGAPGGYWIDGQPVSQQEFRERLPRGPYVVDIGEGGDDAE
jgi:hypothetical protein